MNKSRPSITATTHTLPFHQLSPRDFERLCLWLVQREGFDRAFRREIARVLPERPLAAIPPGHPVLRAPYTIAKVSLSPLGAERNPGVDTPQLEGIEIDGVLAVVYSRFDLGNGWEACSHPYSVGYSGEDALKIGTNVITYALTH